MKTAPWKTVGSRELKTRLGTYLRQVQEGLTLVVTDRGRPIAELRPLEIETGELENQLYRLVELGVLSRESREPGPLPPFIPVSNQGQPVSDAIIEDREDRF